MISALIATMVALSSIAGVNDFDQDKQHLLEVREVQSAEASWVWYATIADDWRDEAARQEQERLDTAAEVTTPVTSYSPSPVVTAPVTSSGACGGSLPPCSVMMCESGGSLTIENPTSSASGKWQIVDSTWNGYGGYASAADAPESVQDAKAAELYANGAGRSHWVC